MEKEYVGINSVVEFMIKEDNETSRVLIVDNKNINSNNQVSKISPLGKALFGYKVGDINLVDCDDSYHVEILKIENPVFEDQKKSYDKKIKTNNVKMKVSDVYGKIYETSLSGYVDYLYDRHYKAFGEKERNSTILHYSRVIVKVIEKEKIGFDLFVEKIGSIANKYDIGGQFEDFGDIGHGTWRNALKRFKEFIEYQKNNNFHLSQKVNTNAIYERGIFWKKYNEILKSINNPFTISVGEQWAVVNRKTAAWGKPCITMDFKYREKCLLVNVFIYNDLKLYNLLLKNREYLDAGFEPKPVWCDGLKGENTKRIKIEIPFVDYDVDEYVVVIKKSIPYVLKFIEKYKPYIEC